MRPLGEETHVLARVKSAPPGAPPFAGECACESIAHRAARHSRTGASAPAGQTARLRSLSGAPRKVCPLGSCRPFACIPEPGGRHGSSKGSTPKTH